MSDRFLKIEDATHYVVAIVIGDSPRAGFTFVAADDNPTVLIGWSYVDGAFSDTTEAYKAARKGRPY